MEQFEVRFYQLKQIEKEKLLAFLERSDMKLWGSYHLYYPVPKGKEAFLRAWARNLIVFETIRMELSGTRIEESIYNRATQSIHQKYELIVR